MATSSSALTVDDVVVSKVEDGHLLLIVTPDPADRLSLLYRGNAWNVQYAVARGARLASRKGGNLWYTSPMPRRRSNISKPSVAIRGSRIQVDHEATNPQSIEVDAQITPSVSMIAAATSPMFRSTR